MRLSELQTKVLKRYVKFHNDAYHSSDMFLAYARTWIIAPVAIVLCYWLMRQSDGFQTWGWFAIGYFTAVLVISLKGISLTGKVWPLLDAIINWERAAQILDENTPRSQLPPKDQA